jgi:hypothetical protein
MASDKPFEFKYAGMEVGGRGVPLDLGSSAPERTRSHAPQGLSMARVRIARFLPYHWF